MKQLKKHFLRNNRPGSNTWIIPCGTKTYPSYMTKDPKEVTCRRCLWHIENPPPPPKPKPFVPKKQLKEDYKGYEITVYRDKAMGGWDNTYFMIFRLSDGLCVEDSFTSGKDQLRTIMKHMKRRVDEFIETKGKSELLEHQY